MPVISRSRCFGHTAENRFIRKIIPHLFILDISAVSTDPGRRNRIFDNGIEQCIGQIHAVLVYQVMQFCYKPQSLGISFKMIEILLHLFTQHIRHRLAAERQLRQITYKPFTNRHFSKMAERRIPYVMDQTCALQNMRDVLFHLWSKT